MFHLLLAILFLYTLNQVIKTPMIDDLIIQHIINESTLVLPDSRELKIQALPAFKAQDKHLRPVSVWSIDVETIIIYTGATKTMTLY